MNLLISLIGICPRTTENTKPKKLPCTSMSPCSVIHNNQDLKMIQVEIFCSDREDCHHAVFCIWNGTEGCHVTQS